MQGWGWIPGRGTEIPHVRPPTLLAWDRAKLIFKKKKKKKRKNKNNPPLPKEHFQRLTLRLVFLLRWRRGASLKRHLSPRRSWLSLALAGPGGQNLRRIASYIQREQHPLQPALGDLTDPRRAAPPKQPPQTPLLQPPPPGPLSPPPLDQGISQAS